MYALSFSAEGDCYWCVLPDPGIAAAALSASASSTPPGTAHVEALHTFTMDSGASRCFFCDSTTLNPLPAPVPVRLDDPSGGPVVASSSTVLPCPAVPSGSLSGLHLPSFSTNLVSTAALQDAMVTTTTSRGQRVSICTCTRMGRHLTTFTRRPGSSLYTLATQPPQVTASAQVSASGQVAASCSCRLLSHQTLLWNHRLGHPSLPRLRGMHSRLLVSGLLRSEPPLPPSPAPPSLPCVEGWQHAAPHSSFPPTTAPLQTLHMDVKGEVSAVLIPWIRIVRLQLRERFGQDLPVLRLHSNRGGEFSSDLLHEFCRGEGIRQTFTLLDSPQQNGIAERRIGLVMEVARTSMIHAAAPHFLWPFAVWYAAHQLNLWPCVSLPETSPTLRWTEKVGDASVFRVWGSRAFVRDMSADKLSARAIPCVFLGFVPDAPGWQFYHPTSRRVLPSQDVTFDVLVPFYRLFPYRSAPSSPPLHFLAPGPPPVAVVSGAGPGTASGGAEPGGAGSEGAGSGGAEPEGVEPGGAESEGAEPGGSESEGAESRAPRAGEPGDAGPGGAAVTTGAGDPTEPGAAGAGGAGAGVAGVGGPGAGGAGAAGAGAVDPRAGGAGGTSRPRPYFVPLLQQSPLQPASPLPVPSPYTEQAGGLTERREPVSLPFYPVCTARRAPHSRPPPVPGTHTMALLRAPSPTVARLLATAVTDPSFDSAAASALVAELLDFAAACRLDYASALVAESVPASPLSVGGECALGMDVLEDRQEEFECLGAALPRFASLLLAPEGDPDAPDIPTPRSYAEAITGASQVARHTEDYTCVSWVCSFYSRPVAVSTRRHLAAALLRPSVLQRFSFQYSSPQPTPLSTSHSLSAPPSDESIEPSGPYPELVGCLMYLMTCTRPDLAYPLSLLARYVAPGRHRKVHWDAAKRVLRYLCSTLSMGLVLGGRGPVVFTGHADASWVDDSATQRSSQGYTFSLGSGSVSWRSTRSSSVLSSSCEAEIYAGAMAAQELRWLIYLLIDLGEQPRSLPVLPTQLPLSVLWKGGVEPRGPSKEDMLVQVALQERVGDVHGADPHVVARTNIDEGAEGGRLGGGGVGEPVILNPSLGETLSAIAGLVDRILARQLLHSKDPLALEKFGVGREGDNNEGVVTNECLTLQEVCRDPLVRIRAGDGLLKGGGSEDGGGGGGAKDGKAKEDGGEEKSVVPNVEELLMGFLKELDGGGRRGSNDFV
ncbi:unnamed protein product [Closterium sp. NIES-54]